MSGSGQVLVLFCMFLLVLLGVAAIGIDYASWLLMDRKLQNTADHAALAGASQFRDRTTQGSCTGGAGQQKCIDARIQMWTSLDAELNLGLTSTIIDCLSREGGLAGQPGNTAAAGETSSARAATNGCTAEPVVEFGHRIWITTPPPAYAAYLQPGGRYASNFGITFTRVDRDVPSFLGGALGVKAQPRYGWATAGALPIGFALQTFCRIGIEPSSGACTPTRGLSIDGQGGIRLVRGDIGTNESLKVTASGGQGVQVHEGNMFLVNDVCAASTWRCPNGPPSLGGISDGAPSYIGENAFYMAPLPVPRFASPLDVASVSLADCVGASATDLCVPYKDQTNPSPNQPGTWTCVTTGSVNRCGAPIVTSGTVTCVGQGGGLPPLHYYPIGPSLNSVNADPAHPQSNANKFRNIDDDFEIPDADTTDPPGDPSTDYLYTDDINITGGGGPQTSTFTVNLGQSGPRVSGISTVRYTAFKTFGGTPDNTGNPVRLRVTLLGGATPISVGPWLDLTNVPDREEFTVGAGVIPAGQFNSLRLEFTFESSGGTTAIDERGGAIAWAGIEHPAPQPPLAPMIPPGYYKSIEIPANACAILDPTAEYSSLKDFQMPGIWRFGGPGANHDKKLSVGDGSFLIGDAVTLVFDPDWPASGSNQGVAIGANGALVLNTMRVLNSSPPCTPTEPADPLSLNQSTPLGDLPYSAVCAAWSIDPRVTAGTRPGQNAWHHCDSTAPDSASHCVERSSYSPAAHYRGVTFYFTPDGNWTKAHEDVVIGNRFEMQGGATTNEAGIAFRGILYAPYDDVKISGSNGFTTVGQVLAWSARFNGGNSFIDLDFPYAPATAAPYLLEPTVDH